MRKISKICAGQLIVCKAHVIRSNASPYLFWVFDSGDKFEVFLVVEDINFDDSIVNDVLTHKGTLRTSRLTSLSFKNFIIL